MTTWVIHIEKEHPEHWEVAKKHGFWDMRKRPPILNHDLVVLWRSGRGPVALVEAIGDAVSPPPGPFPWNDAPEQYKSRFHFECLSESLRHQITWSDLQAAEGRRLPAIAAVNDVGKGGESFLLSLFLGDLDASWSTDDVTYDIPHGHDRRERVVREIAVRRGQPAFRQALLQRYGTRCVVTGSTAEQVLEAAHVDPYKGPHTNTADNGLLLRADIHTLFDLFLLTLTDDLVVRVSPDVDDGTYRALDGHHCDVPPGSRPSADRLRRHRLKCPWLRQAAVSA